MRTCLLAAVALAVSATGCASLKPSHREYKKPTKSETAMESQATGQIQQVQYVEPAGGGVQPAGHHHLQSAPGPYGYAGYGYGSMPYGGGGPWVYGNGPPDYGHPGRPFDGGRYGFFGGAHRTPGYPHHHFSREYVGPQGPPTAQVAYPYYTIRGPRDFLLDNPPSIGR
jgi:hypothetical protein